MAKTPQSKLAREQQARMARTAYLYILPAALLMLLITFWPIIFQFWISFTNFGVSNIRTPNLLLQMFGSFTGDLNTWNSPQLINLKNYLDIFFGGLSQRLTGFDFWRILLFNLVWTFVNVFFHVSIGVAIALLLNQAGFRFKRFYRALYIIPWAMPTLVVVMVWRNMFDEQNGAVNILAGLLGLPKNTRWLQQIDSPATWLPPYVQAPSWADPYLVLLGFILLLILPYFFKWVRERWLAFTTVWVVALELFFGFVLSPLLNALPLAHAAGTTQTVWFSLGQTLPLSFYAALLTNVWLGWPFMMTIATGALQGIPREMYEAAEMDGATRWQSFWKVTVPLIRPAMIPAIILGITWSFNQFNVIYFLTGGGPLHATEILVTQAYRLVNEVRDYGMAAAFAYVVFAILATITLITNRASRATASYAE